MGGWTSRRLSGILVAMATLAGFWGILLWPVQTRQGRNYQVTTYRMPLYLKLTGFVYRDMEFRHLASELTRGVHGDEEKLLRLYDWVRTHLKAGTPPGLPVMDDHVWNIIVRGYGDADQFADALATFCAYAGVPAQLVMVGPPGHPSVHAITMVKLRGRWCPVDSYYGVIIYNETGHVASREEILVHLDMARQAAPELIIGGTEYATLLTWLPDVSSSTELRPYRHMPFRRAWYEFLRGFHALVSGGAP